MAIRLSAAQRIANRRTSIRVGLEHLDRGGVYDVASLTIHSDPDAFTRDGTGDKDDTPLVTREHHATSHCSLGVNVEGSSQHRTRPDLSHM
jgi:hypothetical protein